MQNAWSYIKDYGGLLKKIRNVDNIPENSILVTSDVVRLYPNISHNAGLSTKEIEARKYKFVSTENLDKVINGVIDCGHWENVLK